MTAPGRVAVLGAGVTGLVAAYELAKQGCQCDVYERWAGLGGQAATLDVGGGVLLERLPPHGHGAAHPELTARSDARRQRGLPSSVACSRGPPSASHAARPLRFSLP